MSLSHRGLSFRGYALIAFFFNLSGLKLSTSVNADNGIFTKFDLKICAIDASSLFLNIFILMDVSIESCKKFI
jgi:hypothetical protein